MKSKEQKRQEAEARQAERDARTDEEQLKILEDRGINSGKEYTKLVLRVHHGEKS